MQGLLYLFAVYFFLLPVVFWRGFSDPFNFPRLLLAGLFALLAFAFCGSYLSGLKQAVLKVNIFNLLVFCFLLFAFISAILAKNQAVALFGFYPAASNSLLVLLPAVLVALLFKVLLVKSDCRSLFPFMLAGLLLECLYGFYVYLDLLQQAPSGSEIRISSTQSNPLFFAADMMVGLYLSLAARQLYRGAKGHILLGLAFIFLSGMFLSLSRGVWISALLGLLTALVLSGRWQTLLKSIPGPIKLVCLGVLAANLYFFQGPVLGRLKPLLDFSVTTSHYIRLVELSDAFKLLKDKTPFFGIGPGHLPYYYPAIRSELHNRTQEWYLYPGQVRNQYLDTVISLGYFAALIYLLFILAVCRQARKKLAVVFSGSSFYLFIFSGWVGLLYWGLFYYYGVTAWMYFAFFTAILLSGSKTRPVFVIRLPIKVLSWVFPASIVLGLAGIWFIGRVVLADITFTKGLRYYNRLSYPAGQEAGGLASPTGGSNILFADYRFSPQDYSLLLKAVNLFEQALTMVPYDNALYYRQHASSLALLGRMADKAADKNNHYSLAYDILEGEVKKNPDDHLNWALRSAVGFRMALDSLQPQQSLQAAIKDQQQAIRLDPANPLKYDNLGLMLREAGRLQEAADSFRKAIALKPDYVGSYLHLGEVLLQTDGKAKALEIFRKAQSIWPDNQLLKEKINNTILYYTKPYNTLDK